MAYCSQTDIERRLPSSQLAQLTDDTNGTVVNESNVTRAIADADSEIDMYLRGKHTVPLTTTPDSVRKWSVVLSIHFLYLRRIDLAVPETLKDEYDKVIKQLQEVRDDKLLINDTASVSNTATFVKLNKTSSSRIFTSNDSQTGMLDRYFSSNKICR